MKGLPESVLDKIIRIISSQFDDISMSLLGLKPRIKGKKITFAATDGSLTDLYLRALGSKNPTKDEEQVLKTILRVSSGYVEALKERTQSKVIEAVNSHVQNQQLKNLAIQPSVVRKLITSEMDKAKTHLNLIANAESNKAVNTGTAMQILKVAESNGDKDPTVYFVVTIDDVTGKEEFVLHLLPDRITPRVWKLSEIGTEYHKVGDANPKLPGLHPNCRCKLVYLPAGFGFTDAGRIKWMGPDHDEFEDQREKFGKPR
jgi:hypothetical protein